MYYKDNSTIGFAWQTEKIFEEAKKLTSYQFYFEQQPSSVVPSATDQAITLDEKPLLLGLLSSAINSLYAYFIRVSSPVDNSIVVDSVADHTWQNTVKGRINGFKIAIKAPHQTIYANRLDIIEKHAFLFVVYFIICNRYSLIGQAEISKWFEEQLSAHQTALLQNLVYLQNFSYSKSYSITKEL